MYREQIRLNERASLDRPSWTSEPSTGGLEAFRHLHINKKGVPIIKGHFDKLKGLMK